MRLNNHEHTDIAEYMGTYVSRPGGGLTFVEGALVTAVRNGHWLVLDELNLAPSDVLEALNRLLDDNRELFVAELQEAIRCARGTVPRGATRAQLVPRQALTPRRCSARRPHPHFMLFATQNPPGAYGGRKARGGPQGSSGLSLFHFFFSRSLFLARRRGKGACAGCEHEERAPPGEPRAGRWAPTH